MTDHDIVFVADPCFPGGSSSSLAYEIKAASRAGLRIALRPVRTQRLVLSFTLFDFVELF
jgi:hypothetical protein